ncbi:PREDICTED: calmodulin-binding protein 60 E [Tarenaya hassleriana]|uniref:calmodulin-binding protein 60 E n=1 Tax=Tarenaya hassleriana TaxID=28532 RepID=UPI00053C5051|nr:PREDICTED: calmodulin-binding protein 60 E [Tarenaya hassleriana]
MESSMNKRGYGCGQEDTDNLPESKRQKLPALASVIVEAVKVDSLQRLCSSLEPLFRRIVSEEVERALSRLGSAKLTSRSPEPKKIQGPDGRNLRLLFRTRMPPHLFTGGKVEGEQGSAIHVVLIDANTGNVVQTGEESSARLNVVVLEGDFNDENDEDWTREHFERFEVKEREGKHPILTGDTLLMLKEGVGTLGELTFTDNSSWIRSRKFRLGVKVAPGYCDGVHIREAKTEPFAVKDHRGELYKKHYPPALHDEVWRLDRIAKDGALHKKLLKANIATVEDFLRLLVKDPQRLRTILGSGMSNRMWENTVEHAKTCVLGGKLYVYYTDNTHSTGIVFNHIYEFRGLISNGQFLSLESLNHDQKISADILVKTAYENWQKVVEYDGNVLNYLPTTKKETKSLPEPTIAAARATQNPQLHNHNRQTLQSHQTENNYTSVFQTVEYPFVPLTSNQLPELPCNVQDYTPMANSASSGSYNAGDWCRARSGQGFEENFAEEIRLRSSEMLESDDMQRLLRTFGIGMNTIGTSPGGFGHTDESCYGYSVPCEGHRVDNTYGRERGRGSGKAVVGWLKLKAALRWGIFIRKKAAERRPQLVEID